MEYHTKQITNKYMLNYSVLILSRKMLTFLFQIKWYPCTL